MQAHAWETSVWVDGETGALVELAAPATERPGNRLDAWLRALHFGDLQDSVLYRVFVCTIGFATVMLSVTGIFIWWSKRAARRRAILPLTVIATSPARNFRQHFPRPSVRRPVNGAKT